LWKWHKRLFIEGLQDSTINWITTSHFIHHFCWLRKIGKTLLSQVHGYRWVSHSTLSKNIVNFSVDLERPKVLHGEIERDRFKIHSHP
jgi:hypothetical protein